MSRIPSEVLVPYIMSLGEYSEERASVVFNQLMAIDAKIGQFVKNIIESIPSGLQFDIKTILINFLSLSIEKNIIYLIFVIRSNYELISNQNNLLFNIIMNFYIKNLSEDDIKLIQNYSSGFNINIFEMLQAFRTKSPSQESLDDFLGNLTTNLNVFNAVKENADIDLTKLQHSYTICNLCKKDATSQCSKCKTTRYCSKECQISDWDRHKKICKQICKKICN